eukprot:m.1116580 g.1116580  ORF g.1116580 m.1116580 type:complete len:482 (+) comp24377_c1_seq8:393-1838(+)
MVQVQEDSSVSGHSQRETEAIASMLMIRHSSSTNVFNQNNTSSTLSLPTVPDKYPPPDPARISQIQAILAAQQQAYMEGNVKAAKKPQRTQDNNIKTGKNTNPGDGDASRAGKAGKPATKHACELCHKVFVSQSKVRRHYLVHTREKPFSCTECKTRFTQKSALKVHVQRKHRERFLDAQFCSAFRDLPPNGESTATPPLANVQNSSAGGDRGATGNADTVSTVGCSPSAARYVSQPHINTSPSLPHPAWVGSTSTSNGLPTSMQQGDMVPNNSASAALFAQLQQQHLPQLHPGMYMHPLAMQGAMHLGAAGMLLPTYGFAAPQQAVPPATSTVVSNGNGADVSKSDSPSVVPVPQVVPSVAETPATTNSPSTTATPPRGTAQSLPSIATVQPVPVQAATPATTVAPSPTTAVVPPVLNTSSAEAAPVSTSAASTDKKAEGQHITAGAPPHPSSQAGVVAKFETPVPAEAVAPVPASSVNS